MFYTRVIIRFWYLKGLDVLYTCDYQILVPQGFRCFIHVSISDSGNSRVYMFYTHVDIRFWYLKHFDVLYTCQYQILVPQGFGCFTHVSISDLILVTQGSVCCIYVSLSDVGILVTQTFVCFTAGNITVIISYYRSGDEQEAKLFRMLRGKRGKIEVKEVK